MKLCLQFTVLASKYARTEFVCKNTVAEKQLCKQPKHQKTVFPQLFFFFFFNTNVVFASLHCYVAGTVVGHRYYLHILFTYLVAYLYTQK